MGKSTVEIANELQNDSFSLNQTVKQLDTVRNMLTASWEGEIADEFIRKLEQLTADTEHSRKMIENVAAQLVQKG